MINIFKLKIMSDRVRWYLSLVQFAMVAYLFIAQTTFNLVTTLLLIAVSVPAIAFLDWRFIFSKEQLEISKKNPVLTDILETLRSIDNKLEEREGSK